MEKYLAYVDLLGFAVMIERDLGRSKELLNNFYEIVYSVLSDNDAVSGNISSDCLLAYSNDYPTLINSLTRIYRECFYFNATSADFWLLPRGAISRGFMEIGDRDTSIKLTRDFMIGTALVHSSKLEQQIKGSRLLFAIKSSDAEYSPEFQEGAGLSSPILRNCAFGFWENHTYNDILWPIDYEKDMPTRLEESRKLLEIAIKLLKANSHNAKVLDHYTNTVRVCLLSYSTLEKNALPTYMMVITEFSQDCYWLLWLTVIEIISEPANAPQPAPSELISLIRSLCLCKGWTNIIEELQKPEKNYLKKALLNLLDT